MDNTLTTEWEGVSPGSHQMEETMGHTTLEGLGLASPLFMWDVSGATDLDIESIKSKGLGGGVGALGSIWEVSEEDGNADPSEKLLALLSIT